MTLTFDGLYMTVTTPEVTLHWDGLGSLIIGVSPDTQTLGLCGSNREGEALRPRFKRRRSYLQGELERSLSQGVHESGLGGLFVAVYFYLDLSCNWCNLYIFNLYGISSKFYLILMNKN